MYKQKGRATSSSNISYGPSQGTTCFAVVIKESRLFIWVSYINIYKYTHHKTWNDIDIQPFSAYKTL